MIFEHEIDAWNEEKGFYKIKVKAMRTDVPGLILTESDANDHFYRLTHERSGLSVTPGMSSPDVFALLELAVEFGEIADWTCSAPDLVQGGVGPRCHPLLVRWMMTHEYRAAGGPPRERSVEAVERSEVDRAVH